MSHFSNNKRIFVNNRNALGKRGCESRKRPVFFSPGPKGSGFSVGVWAPCLYARLVLDRA